MLAKIGNSGRKLKISSSLRIHFDSSEIVGNDVGDDDGTAVGFADGFLVGRCVLKNPTFCGINVGDDVDGTTVGCDVEGVDEGADVDGAGEGFAYGCNVGIQDG